MIRVRRGFVLILAILLSALLFFFALAAVNLSRAEGNLAFRGEQDVVAATAATAGIEAAFAALSQDSSWSAGFQAVELPNSGGRYSLTFNRTQAVLPWSTNNARGLVGVTGWDGRVVPAGAIHLVCVGTAGPAQRREEALLVAPSLPYGYPLFGHLNGGTLGVNALVDSYDSSLGPYPASLQPAGGNLGTNSIATGRIVLANGSIVKGRIRVGPGGTAAVVTGPGTYQGLEVPGAAYPVSPVAAPSSFGNKAATVTGTVTLAPGVYQDMRANPNSRLILRAGNYVFRRFESQVNLTLEVQSAPVNVYLIHRARLGAGARLNVAGVPGGLNFFGAGSGEAREFSLGDGSVARFTLNAPEFLLTVGKDAELFTSALVRQFAIGDRTKVHYDQFLAGKRSEFGVISRW